MKKMTILGGDLRTIELAKMFLQNGNSIASFGIDFLDKIKENDNLIKCNTLEEAIQFSNIIITPIPFSKDGETLFSNLNEEVIKIDDLLKENISKILIGGNIPKKILKELEQKYKTVYDLMDFEKLVIYNTIATAEGTIKEAITNTDITIQNSNILILGFGRVAKEVALKFKALGANVTCSARKESDLAWIKVLGYNLLNINYLKGKISNYDIIINTVPSMILDKEELSELNKNTLIIDLASRPGGVNFELAKQIGIKYVWALALPGRIAPKTSAEYIKECINDII